MKLSEYQFTIGTRQDLSLVDALNTIASIVNQGRYQMRVSAVVPNWVGEDGEHLLYISGTVRRLYFYDLTNATWQFVEFNNSGRGQATIAAIVQLTGQGAAITTTTLFTPSTQGLYRVSVYMVCSATGTGTLSCTIGFSDVVGGKTVSPATTVDLSSTANGATGMTFIESVASVAITYATAISGLVGSPKYAIYLLLEELS